MEFRIRSSTSLSLSLSVGQLTTKHILKNAVIIMFVIINITNVESLKCYKCTMTKPSPHTNETVRLCAHFDYSDRYVIDCPYSTMCTKKDISVNLPTPINGTERDCALQRYDYQDLEDGRWQLKVAIEEPYAEGCAVTNDKGLRSSRTEYCYCRGELCNTAARNPPLVFSLIGLQLVVVLISTLYNVNK